MHRLKQAAHFRGRAVESAPAAQPVDDGSQRLPSRSTGA